MNPTCEGQRCHLYESDKEEFFSNLTKLMPTSATLTAVAKQPPKPTNSNVILKLPPTLKTYLHDPKYKDLSKSDFEKACESIFQKLSITNSEATYLEESTRLQSQSKLWFDHRVGRITRWSNHNFDCDCRRVDSSKYVASLVVIDNF